MRIWCGIGTLVLMTACSTGSPGDPDGAQRDAAMLDAVDSATDSAHALVDAWSPLVDAFVPDGGSIDGGTSDAIFPLRVSSDAHHLVDQAGNAFLLQGDSPWELIQNLTEADTLAYLDDRHSRGFNTILIELVEHEFTPHTPPSADVTGEVPFADVNDWTTTREAYFAHVDWVLERARERGFLVLLVPAYIGYGCGDEGWCVEMRANGAARLRQYGHFVGARYRTQPNIVWVEGGDYTPSGTELDLINAVAAGIIDGDGGAHLHTAHWSRGTHSADVTGITFPLGLDASYTGGPPGYPQLEQNVASGGGARPLFVIENRYEGEASTTAAQLRAQMYEPILTGEAGFLFGNDPLWYLGENGDGNPGWTFGGSAFHDWHAALDGQGSRDDARAGAFFRSIAWDVLRPDTTHTVMTAGYGTSGDALYAHCASATDGTLAALYVPGALSPHVALSRFTAPVNAYWFDPTNASITMIGTAIANTGDRVFATPGANSAGDADWLLVLTRH